MKKLLLFLFAAIFWHAACAVEQFGTVDALSGSATMTDQGGNQSDVAVGMSVYEGETINSGADGEVHIVTEDGGIIAIRPNTTFRIDQYTADGTDSDRIFMTLLKGAIRSITGWIGKHDPDSYRLNTPTVILGVRGTDHETAVVESGGADEPGTYDTVYEGETVLKSDHGELDVKPGKYAFAPLNRARVPFFLAREPRFLIGRKLRLEGRIARRKEFLRTRLEEMRSKRIERLRRERGRMHDRYRERPERERMRRDRFR